MSRTDILITPCGGIGTVLTFLPPGATAIVMNFWQSVTETSIQMESIYYWNLEFLDIQYFPVLLEDYDLSSDRPECEKPEDDPYFEEQVSRPSCCLTSCCLPDCGLPLLSVYHLGVRCMSTWRVTAQA